MLSQRTVIGIGCLVVLIFAYYLRSYANNPSKIIGRRVETKLGSFRGILSVSRDGREFYEWLGIPYAKAPVGSLRFASPQPIEEAWDGVRDASSYGSSCAQLSMLDGNFEGEEDCLFLNVHVPKPKLDMGHLVLHRRHMEGENSRSRFTELLPVLLYIHGGMFMHGSADQHKPHYFMDENVMVVTINYRVGALGFLSLGDSVLRGNMGLKDQSMALRWVRENIANFGGDPAKVTIFGQSAGSKSVHYHMLSPMSQGLMSRAISQSGTALNLFTLQDDPVGQAMEFVRKLNCSNSLETSEIVQCLRNVDVNDLLEVQRRDKSLPRTKYTTFAPCVEIVMDEDTFLPDEPGNLINSGKIAKIPWLVGLVADEGLLYSQKIVNDAAYRETLENDWDLIADTVLFLNEKEKKLSGKIKEFYFGNPIRIGKENLDFLNRDFESIRNLLTDRWYSYGIYKTALAHAQHQHQHASVQFYYYTKKDGPSIFPFMVMLKGKFPPVVEILLGMTKNWLNSVLLGIPPTNYGVCHGDELAILFHDVMGIFKISQRDPNYTFSKDLVASWVSFATIDNVDDAAFRGHAFPRVKPNEELKVLEINEDAKIRKFPTQNRMLFWQNLEKLIIN